MMPKITPVRQVRNVRHVTNLFQNRRTLWQMLREVWHGRYRMSLFTNVALLFGILYILFPFDLVTDLIPFFGWLDDGFVFFLLVRRLHKETQRFIRFKVMERKGNNGY